MIPPRKNRLFNAWFAGHAEKRIKNTFGKIYVRGLEEVREQAKHAPLLLVSNHTSWWDPLVILHASTHLLKTDGHAMMDAKNLRRLPFFALVGAFGVDLDRPQDGMAAIRQAVRLLDQPRKLVWIFPQGEEQPVFKTPLGFREGSAHVAWLAKHAVTIPAALRYEFSHEEMPRLYLSFGAPVARERDPKKACLAQESAVLSELTAIENEILGKPVAGLPFQTLFETGPTWLSRLAERFLAVLTRGAIKLPSPKVNPDDRS